MYIAAFQDAQHAFEDSMTTLTSDEKARNDMIIID